MRFIRSILFGLATIAFAAGAAIAQEAPNIPHAELDKAGTRVISSGPLRVTLGATKQRGKLVPRVIGEVNGAKAFEIAGAASGLDGVATHARIVTLEKGDMPQVLFSWFTFGAHCCAETRIASYRDGRWSILKPPVADGEEAFTVIRDGGEQALAGVDNRFLYKFDSYAGSYAPDQIYRLRAGKLVEATRDPQLTAYLRKTLAEREKGATDEPDTWKTNGFLAGWVAQKALLGEQADAWKRMLVNYDRESTWGIPECEGDKPAPDCADPKRLALKFPRALRAFLVASGYVRADDPAVK